MRALMYVICASVKLKSNMTREGKHILEDRSDSLVLVDCCLGRTLACRKSDNIQSLASYSIPRLRYASVELLDNMQNREVVVPRPSTAKL